MKIASVSINGEEVYSKPAPPAEKKPRPQLDGMLWAARDAKNSPLCFIADALYRIAEAIEGSKVRKRKGSSATEETTT